MPDSPSPVEDGRETLRQTLQDFVAYWRAAFGDHAQRRMFHISRESLSPVLTAIESLDARCATLERERDALRSTAPSPDPRER